MSRRPFSAPHLRLSLGRPLASILCAGAFALVLTPFAARATVISGMSEGYDAQVQLAIPALSVDINHSPIALASGTAPPPYSDSQSVPVSGSVDGITFSATEVATASSDVDGTAGARTTDASGGIENGTLTISASSITLLALSVSAISSDASITGDYGTLAASGGMSLVTVTLQLDGLSPWNWSGTPAPNTVAYDSGGIQVVLNEQIQDCAGPSGGTDTCSLEVNAVHVTVNGPIGGYAATGEAILGHSFATMTAVPEPGTVLLLGSGLALLARRRRSH